MKTHQLVVVRLDHRSLAPEVAAAGSQIELRTPSGMPHRNPTPDRGWLLCPTGSKVIDALNTPGAWPRGDRWWERPDILGDVSASRGWCLAPWGPAARLQGLAVAVLGRKWQASLSGSALARLPGSPRVISTYPLVAGERVDSRAAIVEGEDARYLAATDFFAEAGSPMVVGMSPDGFACLSDEVDDAPGWLEEGCEILGAIDGSGKANAPWLYRPRHESVFLEMCRLSRRARLVAASEGTDPGCLAADYQRGAFLDRIGDIGGRPGLLFATPFGHDDLGASLIAGREVAGLLAGLMPGGQLGVLAPL